MNPFLKQICGLLKSNDRDIRWAAARVLGEIHAEGSVVVCALGEALREEQDPALRGFLFNVAAKNRHKAFLPYLLSCLGEAGFQQKVIGALAAYSKGVVPDLTKRYDKAPEGEQRAMLEVLARVGGKEALDFTLSAMSKRPQFEHLKFVCALLREPVDKLEKTERAWFRDRLIQSLKRAKGNDTLTTSVLILLGYLRDIRTQTIFLNVLRDTKSKHVKRHALIVIP